MNQLTLNHAAYGARRRRTQVTAFFLVLARVSPLFLLAPLFSSTISAARASAGVVAVALAIGLTALAMHGQHIPTDPLQVAALIVVNCSSGSPSRSRSSALLAAVQTAGGLADIVSGFSFGATVDPINGNHGGVFAELYAMLGAAIFLAIGGDAWMMRGLARTFTLVPLTKSPQITSLANGAEQSFAPIFASALEVAAPVLLALLITDVAFGMVSRVVPQLNVFAVGFPVKVGVALLVVAASLPFLGGWMSRPDLHLGRHRAARPQAGRNLSDGRSTTRQRRRQPSAERGPQEGPGRQEHRPQRRGRARRPGCSRLLAIGPHDRRPAWPLDARDVRADRQPGQRHQRRRPQRPVSLGAAHDRSPRSRRSPACASPPACSPTSPRSASSRRRRRSSPTSSASTRSPGSRTSSARGSAFEAVKALAKVGGRRRGRRAGADPRPDQARRQHRHAAGRARAC